MLSFCFSEKKKNKTFRTVGTGIIRIGGPFFVFLLKYRRLYYIIKVLITVKEERHAFKSFTAGLTGIDGMIITIECSTAKRMPVFDIVGLPDAAVKESKDRIRSAIRQSGYEFPDGEVIINMAPADRKKEGSGYDMPMCIALLKSTGFIPDNGFEKSSLFLGEVSLDGEFREVRGVLNRAVAARGAGITEMFVPECNAAEASVVEGLKVYPVHDLKQLTGHLCGTSLIEPYESRRFGESKVSDVPGMPDFSDVLGQEILPSMR